MRALIVTMALLLFSSFAQADSVRAFFTYDHQDIPELYIAGVELWMNNIIICEDSVPVIDPDEVYNYSCENGITLPVGNVGFYMIVITENGERSRSNTLSGFIPPVDDTTPDPIPPTLDRIDIRRDADGFEMTIES